MEDRDKFIRAEFVLPSTLVLAIAVAMVLPATTQRDAVAALRERQMSGGDDAARFPKYVYGFIPCECSPEFEGEEKGILINVPARVVITADGGTSDTHAAFPICITLQFGERFLDRFDHVFRHVNVVLVDEQAKKTYGGSIWRDRQFRPARRAPQRAEEALVTNYYTTNIFEHVKLPPRTARYRVYVTLGPHKSNVRSVEVVHE
jgi:hypothetical protein